MTKETAVKAAQLLEDIEVAGNAIDDVYHRDSFQELPAEIRHEIIQILDDYQLSLTKELEDL